MPTIDSELEPVHAFASVVREFCSLVEGQATLGGDRHDFARTLARLIACGFDLPPDIDEETSDTAPGADVEHSVDPEWFAAFSSTVYFDVFDPLADPPAELVGNSLVDDLSDVYTDIKRGLALYDAGHVRGACWEWRFHFWIHWGEHASGALRALYWIMRNAEE